jgi:hypothetical protein
MYPDWHFDRSWCDCVASDYLGGHGNEGCKGVRARHGLSPGQLGARARAVQGHYVQALTEIAVEKNSARVLPLPLEFPRAFMGTVDKSK